MLPIPMELRKKLQISSQMFIAIWESKLNLKYFAKNSQSTSISEVIDSEISAYLNA